MLKGINISCEKANEICNKAQYNDASFIEKIKLNLHILTCKICALYSKQNNLLTKAYNQKAKQCSIQKFELDEETKNRLREELKKEI